MRKRESSETLSRSISSYLSQLPDEQRNLLSAGIDDKTVDDVDEGLDSGSLTFRTCLLVDRGPGHAEPAFTRVSTSDMRM